LKSLLILALVFISTSSFSQNDEPRKSELFVEIGGPSVLGSVNYGHMISSNGRNMFCGRVGFGVMRLNDFNNSFNPDFSVPFGVNYGFNLLPKHRNTFTINGGAGFVYTSIIKAGKLFKPVRHDQLNFYFEGGFRYAFTNGLFFRLMYTPVIAPEPTISHLGGLSIGYAFK
jgi:hypothetical protein